MSYDKYIVTVHSPSVDLTGTSLTESRRFSLPKDAILVYYSAVIETAPSATEDVYVYVGSGSDPDAYGTLVLSDATINTVVDSDTSSLMTFVTETDNATMRKRITGGTEVTLSHYNDGALVAGVASLTAVFRLLDNV